MTSKATSITREDLDQRIRSELASFSRDELAWWSAHHITPYLFSRNDYVHFAVARGADSVLLFFDRPDRFGEYSTDEWWSGLTLFTDLSHAVRCLAMRDSLSNLLKEATSRFLDGGFLDRGVVPIQSRVLEILRAIGPDAAAAVPKLIEISGREDPTWGLQEEAVAALAAIGPKSAEAVPKLIEMAEFDEANSRSRCLHAFGQIGPAAAEAVPWLIDVVLKRASFDPDPFDVAMAANALGNIGAAEALPAFMQVLQETDDSEVALAVVDGIGKLGPQAAEAESLLADMAEGRRFAENEFIRRTALTALARIGKPIRDIAARFDCAAAIDPDDCCETEGETPRRPFP